MTAECSVRSSTSSITRSLSLLLTILLVFPDVQAAAQSCTSSSWTTESSALPANVETLNTVVNNGVLYALGGWTALPGGKLDQGTFRDTVSYFVLSKVDGSLGPLNQSSNHLKVPLSRDLCGVVYNGYLYTVGGVESASGTGLGTTTNNVRYAKINSTTKNIGAWNTQTFPPNNPPAVQLHGTVALTIGTTGYMYIIGGSTGTNISNAPGGITAQVWYAQINGNGSLGSFTRTTDIGLPVQSIPLYKTCPVVVNGTIYVVGGESNLDPNNPAVNTVYYATPNSDGSISQWSQGATLPTNDSTGMNTLAPQAVAYVNTKGIVTMGGDACGKGCDSTEVLEGVVNGVGNITWSVSGNPPPPTPLPALPSKTSRNAGATFNHYAYSAGGLVASTDSAGINCLLVP